MAKLYSEELTDFTKEQKEKLMQFAAKDENYIFNVFKNCEHVFSKCVIIKVFL